jgi:hypothetical protein
MPMDKVSRRGLAKLVGAVSLAGSARVAKAATPTPFVAGPAPWALITPFKAGDDLGFGWQIADLQMTERGSAQLSLAHSSSKRKARVDLRRRSGEPRGLAHTATLDLMLMNGATGSMRSDEALGRAVRAFAARLETSAESLELASLSPHVEANADAPVVSKEA